MLKHLHQGLWLAAGFVFLLLGFIGLLLPVVPQLIFFVLALVSFTRCSKRFSLWMERAPWFARLREKMSRLRRR